MTSLFLLSAAAAVSMNALLQFGIGLRSMLWNRSILQRSAVLPSFVVFACAAAVWPLFHWVVFPLSLGFLEPLLLFPVCALISLLLERLFRCIPWFPPVAARSSVFSAFDGLGYAAGFMTLRYASSPMEALFLALGAALGFYFADLVLWGIRRRCEVESVPRFIRGIPLLLISSGLLALLGSYMTMSLAKLALSLN